MNPDEYIQYFIVNRELGMSPGKMAAQVAHVATDITLYYTMLENDDKKTQAFWDWLNFSRQKKIVLQAKQKQIDKLIENEELFYIIDSGLTEIPEGSITVVGLPPMKRSEAQKYVKRLQLYRA